MKKRKKKLIKKLKKVRKNFCNDIDFLAKIKPSIQERDRILGDKYHQNCLPNGKKIYYIQSDLCSKLYKQTNFSDAVSESEETEIPTEKPETNTGIKKRMKKKRAQKREKCKSDDSSKNVPFLHSSTDTDIYLQND